MSANGSVSHKGGKRCTSGSFHELNEGQDGSDRVGNLFSMQSALPQQVLANQFK